MRDGERASHLYVWLWPPPPRRTPKVFLSSASLFVGPFGVSSVTYLPRRLESGLTRIVYNNQMKDKFHMFIRCGLAGHGVIHIIETAANIYEQAWISASLSAFAGFLMIAGALIDSSHHKTEKKENK